MRERQSFELAPAFLSMADVIMLPQRPGPISAGQMPTKIPEAMAMGVPMKGTKRISPARIPQSSGLGSPIAARTPEIATA